MFSYGSGLASSMFSFKVVRDINDIRSKLNITERLQNRIKISAEDYEAIMDNRRNYFNKTNFTPQVNMERLSEGTYYLTGVDAKYRRNYARKGKSQLLSRNEVKNEVFTAVIWCVAYKFNCIGKLRSESRQQRSERSENPGFS